MWSRLSLQERGFRADFSGSEGLRNDKYKDWLANPSHLRPKNYTPAAI